MSDQFATTTEAAAVLGVSPRRVQAMCESGTLPAVKLGRDWLISRTALAERIERKPRAGRPARRAGPEA